MLRSNRAIQISDVLLEGYHASSTPERHSVDNHPSSTNRWHFSRLAALLIGGDLMQASALPRPKLLKLILSSTVASIIALLLALKTSFTLLPLTLVPYFALRFFAWRAAYRRAESFEHDYPAFLLALCSSIRTGLDPLSALQNLEQLFPTNAELGRELKRLNELIAMGKSEEQAISAFGRTIRHPDITLFRTAFLLARRQGSSLGEALHRLSRVTRTRQSFRRKMRGAVAMQRLSAFGILFCAIAIGFFQAITSPAALRDAFADPIGKQALGAGVALILIGIGWMIRLTRQRI